MQTNPAVNSDYLLDSKPWMLYQFIVCIFNLLLHDENYDPHELSENLIISFNLKCYFRLQQRLNASYYFTSPVHISPSQMLSLFIFTDQIFKALFIQEYEQIKKAVSEKLIQVKEDWDKALNEHHENILDASKTTVDYPIQLAELLKQ